MTALSYVLGRSAFWEFYSRGYVPLLISVWSRQRLLWPDGKLQVWDTHGSFWVHLWEGILREGSTVRMHRWVPSLCVAVSVVFSCVGICPHTPWVNTKYFGTAHESVDRLGSTFGLSCVGSSICRWLWVGLAAPLILLEFSHLFGDQLAGGWSKRACLGLLGCPLYGLSDPMKSTQACLHGRGRAPRGRMASWSLGSDPEREKIWKLLFVIRQ